MFKINRVSLAALAIAAFWFVAISPSTWAAKTCYDCHKKAQSEFSSRKIIHDPVKKVQCESCHKRHGFANQLTLVDNTAQLCYTCHPETKEKLASGKIHYPVEKGLCWDCHDPHASDKKGLIKKGQEGVDDPSGCMNCHGEDIATLGKSQFKHTPYESKACVLCHDPHNSLQVALLKDTPAALCGSCHKTDDKKFKQSHEGKLSAGVDCVDCHTGHSSSLPPLLKRSLLDTCLGCHDEEIALPSGRKVANMAALLKENPNHHGPIRQADCSACHNPHASAHANLLTQTYPPVFYAPFNPDNYRLCFTCHRSELVSAEDGRGVTEFRQGNLNLHYMHVSKQNKGRTCRACHAVHASKSPAHLSGVVPYGNWKYEIKFEPTQTGGVCAAACHATRAYDRTEESATK